MKLSINRPIASAKVETTSNNIIVKFDSVSLMALYRYGKERSKIPLFEVKEEQKLRPIK